MDLEKSTAKDWFTLQDDQTHSDTGEELSETEIDLFQQYPKTQPFIHDEYRRDPSKPFTAYPESNRKGNYVLKKQKLCFSMINPLSLQSLLT